MATEAQIAANRANALKSTGPRTAAGKARSSQNALHHGFCARNLRTSAEHTEQFNELLAEFRAEYRPRTASESALVDALATARWRATRMTNLEVAASNAEARIRNQFNRAFARLSILMARPARIQTSGDVPPNQPTKPVDEAIHVSHLPPLTTGLPK